MTLMIRILMASVRLTRAWLIEWLARKPNCNVYKISCFSRNLTSDNGLWIQFTNVRIDLINPGLFLSSPVVVMLSHYGAYFFS